MRVYISGPISIGDQFLNARAAIAAAAEVMALGHEPFVPHLTFLLHMHTPQSYERWMAYDFAWIDCCQALIRLPGESKGADREVAFANQKHIQVLDGVDGFRTYMQHLEDEVEDRAFEAGG